MTEYSVLEQIQKVGTRGNIGTWFIRTVIRMEYRKNFYYSSPYFLEPLSTFF